MENQNNNKSVIVLLIVIIVILSVLCILFATGTISFKSNDVLNDKENQNLIDNNNHENDLDNENITNDKLNDENKQENIKYKTISLSKEKETFDYDKLHLDFDGIPIKGENGYFNYVLNIKYDGKNINSSFFNDKENYKIWSSNMAANFKIYRLENLYILISFIAKQCFYDEILIFNTNGDILKEFSTAEFSITDSDITIRTSDNGQCMGDGWEEHVKEYKFKIDDLRLIEQ